MFLWKPILRLKAKNVTFEEEGYDLSDSTFSSYDKIKILYKNLIKDFVNAPDLNPPEVMKNFLSFYLQSETLILNLLNEMFNKSFMETIEKRKHIFDLLNKIMKLMIHIDIIRLKHPDIFCHYTLYKINNPKVFEKQHTELEDKRFSILSLITLPMGRMIISLFTSDKFELFYPTLLSKRARIHLDNEKKKLLYTYCRISEGYGYKYILIYFVSIYKRFYGNKSYSFDYEIPEMCKDYIDMLYAHE